MTVIVALVFIYLAKCQTSVFAHEEVQNEQGCFTDCPPLVPDPTDEEIRRNNMIKLHCRTDSSIVITWPVTDYNETEYLIEYQLNEVRYSMKWERQQILKTNRSSNNLAAIEKLKGGYRFRITPFKNGRPYGDVVMLSKMFTTLTPTMPLTNIQSAYFTNCTVTADRRRLSTQLIWTPIKEYVCGYHVTLWKVDLHTVDEITPTVDQIYNMTLQNLNYSSLYQVHLIARTPWADTEEYLLSLATPTCNEMNNYDNVLCSPDPPKGLRIKYTKCVIVVAWEKPAKNPDFYLVNIISHEKRSSLKKRIVGDRNSITIDTTDLSEQYEIHIVALVNEKPSPEVVLEEKNLCDEHTAAGVWYGVLFLSGWGLAFFGCCTLCACLRMYSRDRDEGRRAVEIALKDVEARPEVPLEEGHFYVAPQELEILPQSLECGEVLGAGEFGVVFKGLLHGRDGATTTVAIKALKKKVTRHYEVTASGCENLLGKEAKVMRTIGSHTNLVSMLAYLPDARVLVVEYCALGDLQKFLRKSWETLLITKELIQNAPSTSSGGTEQVISNLMYGKTEVEKKQMTLGCLDLMSFAKQIATGMQYLERNKIVHRDLAARNVLLTDTFTAKISDFGLSRDIYEENVYRRRGGMSMLPIKWLALESLLCEVFTSKSDVWSYGILLWEIFTLGGIPYPMIPPEQVVNMLRKGYRLEQPDTCPNELYELMTDCWKTCDYQRPTFTQVLRRIESILQKEEDYPPLDIPSILYTHADILGEYEKKTDTHEYKRQFVIRRNETFFKVDD